MTNLAQGINLKAHRRFRRVALNTVISLYFLIVAGGVVRSTGAGMGCPDWPKCFGSWIPPTEVSQLPLNYKEIYGAKLKGEIEFNPVKTWIEYVNRLLGAFTGLMIFSTLLASIPFLKTGNRKIFILSLVAFILVGVQGWLGAKVVSTELMPAIITLHMFLAVVIVFVLLYLFVWAEFNDSGTVQAVIDSRLLNGLGLGVLFLSLAQILLGTQVREVMDEVIRSLGYDARAEWVDALGFKFYIHRSFSIVIAAVNLYWFYKLVQNDVPVIRRIVLWCLAMIGAEVITGVVMAYFGVPAFAQPLHLTFAIVLIGLQFVVWLLINHRKYLSLGKQTNVSREFV